MSVLVINGSPKKNLSNTMVLTNAFIDGAEYNNVEVFNVYDMNIEHCLGCFSCWNKTPGICVLNDDMKEFLNKMIEAETIIWSFPLYYFNVPAGLKNLIDRQLPLNLPFMDRDSISGFHIQRYDLKNQKHILISTCGLWTTDDNYDAVVSMFDRFLGPSNYEKIFCAQGELFRYPQLKVKTEPYIELIKRAGKEYVEGKIEDDTRLEIEKPLFDRKTFEDMADASWGVDLKSNSHVPLDESLILTKQMAALYKPDGKNRVLEMNYTDIDKTYQILLNEDGSKVITENFQPYTTKIVTSYTLWKSISNNEVSGPEAFFKRRYKVMGDVKLMLDWDKLFNMESLDTNEYSHKQKFIDRNKSQTSSDIGLRSTAAVKEKFPNMIMLLLPWVIFWSVFPVNPKAGAVLGILSSTLLPLLWKFIKPVSYEHIGFSLLSVLSLLALLASTKQPTLNMNLFLPSVYLVFGITRLIKVAVKAPTFANYNLLTVLSPLAFLISIKEPEINTNIFIPLSYLVFGAVWLVGAINKVPLTANYSASKLGGERKAFSNPIFIITNRVLTAAWAAMFLLSSVLSLILQSTELSNLTGLVIGVPLMLMGIFTAWFQKWYPNRLIKKLYSNNLA